MSREANRLLCPGRGDAPIEGLADFFAGLHPSISPGWPNCHPSRNGQAANGFAHFMAVNVALVHKSGSGRVAPFSEETLNGKNRRQLSGCL
jgi:hypothetical protein